MADYDNVAQPLPQLPAVNKGIYAAGRPTIANLKTALAAVNGGASYTPARLSAMTYNDLVAAARLHSLAVTTVF